MAALVMLLAALGLLHFLLPLGTTIQIGADEGFELAKALLCGLCALTWMGSRVYLQIAGIRHSPQTHNSLVLFELERLKPFARFMYASEPVYSFHAGIPMPPNLAVVPLKRLWSGNLTDSRIAAELAEVGPEVFLLRNDGREVAFSDLLASSYRLVYEDAEHRLHTTKSLARAAGY